MAAPQVVTYPGLVLASSSGLVVIMLAVSVIP
jgi:hypothetical protein